MSTDGLEHQVYYNPAWIQANGGWIHANNVHFYFRDSPFFERRSDNNEVFTQNMGDYHRELQFLATKELFEAELEHKLGIQYVVEVDPLANRVDIEGPNGKEQSMIWVIRKQRRLETGKKGKTTTLGYYYIMNDAIFQAPMLQSVMEYRMLNTLRAMDQMLEKSISLPFFSAAEGNTYSKPAQGHASTGKTAVENTTNDGAVDGHLGSSEKSLQATLRQALDLTVRHGKSYGNNDVLTGEPGNFRYARARENQALTKGANSSSGAAVVSKAGSSVSEHSPSRMGSRIASPAPG